jgi:ADP-heptose:LPS heptosyltransferase
MPEKGVLVYRLGSLGDTIIALPAFHAVRRAFPERRIVLLTNRPVSEKAAAVESILGRGYFFDEVLDYPVGTRNPSVLAGLLGALRDANLEVAVNLAAFRSVFSMRRDKFFLRMAGVRHFYGFDLGPRDRRACAASAGGEVEWEAARIARRAAKLALVDLDDPSNWDLRLEDAEVEVAKALLKPLPSDQPVMAFGVGTKMQAKHWGTGKWRELSARLAAKLPSWRAVFVGSGGEAVESMECVGRWDGRALNLCGSASPRETAAVLERCAVFVGHDSGPMHLAACMGVPCVAVFSGRNLARQWFPRGNGNTIIQRRPACAGCGLEVCVENAKRCLEEIAVDEVERAVLEIVAR